MLRCAVVNIRNDDRDIQDDINRTIDKYHIDKIEHLVNAIGRDGSKILIIFYRESKEAYTMQ